MKNIFSISYSIAVKLNKISIFFNRNKSITFSIHQIMAANFNQSNNKQFSINQTRRFKPSSLFATNIAPTSLNIGRVRLLFSEHLKNEAKLAGFDAGLYPVEFDVKYPPNSNQFSFQAFLDYGSDLSIGINYI